MNSKSSNIIILDNGSGYIKVGNNLSTSPYVFPNAIAKYKKYDSFIGNSINNINSLLSIDYNRPFHRSLLMNTETQIKIWDHTFFQLLKINPSESSILITEIANNLPNISSKIDEILFEKYKFNSICRATNAPLFAYLDDININKDCFIVIDSGFSSTQIVPVVNGIPLNYSIKRISVGGRLLTNFLKEQISLRQFNIDGEFRLSNRIKEKFCYVSLDFTEELHKYQNNKRDLIKFFVLPNNVDRIGLHLIKDRKELKEWKSKPNDQIAYMKNEMITVPELLFNPSYININEAGIAEGIIQSINNCPIEMRQMLLENIILCGGNTCFPNFKKRLEKELRILAPDEYDININLAKNPISSAWMGALNFTRREDYFMYVITKNEYLEYGDTLAIRKFNSVFL